MHWHQNDEDWWHQHLNLMYSKRIWGLWNEIPSSKLAFYNTWTMKEPTSATAKQSIWRLQMIFANIPLAILFSFLAPTLPCNQTTPYFTESPKQHLSPQLISAPQPNMYPPDLGLGRTWTPKNKSTNLQILNIWFILSWQWTMPKHFGWSLGSQASRTLSAGTLCRFSTNSCRSPSWQEDSQQETSLSNVKDVKGYQIHLLKALKNTVSIDFMIHFGELFPVIQW